MGKNVFADDDRVIDDDAQGHDKGKQRKHVDRGVKRLHQHKGPQKADGDTHHHPESQAQVEEEAQTDEDQHQTELSIADQQIDATAQDACVVARVANVDPRRQGLAFVLDVLVDIVGDVEGVLVANAKDLHHGRWLAVEARDEIGILKAIDDRGHVFELKGRAVGAGEHYYLFVFAPRAHQPLRAEQDRAILALDAAGG